MRGLGEGEREGEGRERKGGERKRGRGERKRARGEKESEGRERDLKCDIRSNRERDLGGGGKGIEDNAGWTKCESVS
eukprot:715937-Amorphochlora_amoeboformis.AAC.1